MDKGQLEIDELLLEAEEIVAEEAGRPEVEGPLVSAPRPAQQHDTVVVLDFGSQYSQLIVRRVRELGVYAELLPCDAPQAERDRLAPAAFILSGGPASVYEPGAPQLPRYVLGDERPVLGICYGLHLLTRAYGGEVEGSTHREFGPATIRRVAESPLFEGLGDSLPVWMSHGDRVMEPPAGFELLAVSDNAPVAAMGRGPVLGIQFHPEVIHTPQGKEELSNFLFGVAGLRPTWNSASFIETAIDQIREAVGEGRVLCGLSGGVDSSVAAALVQRAIGDRLVCLFVDNGLLRQNEAAEVVETFGRNMHMNLVAVDAADRFLDRLEGIDDP
ncbi:MAG TPA: glutamine-hydrolyzing GMP synthase, partial [Chloroflexia bacterium]|nr:glutamine-hydrolyzing GMP synthase [Chloroflexia bacterium]